MLSYKVDVKLFFSQIQPWRRCNSTGDYILDQNDNHGVDWSWVESVQDHSKASFLLLFLPGYPHIVLKNEISLVRGS